MKSLIRTIIIASALALISHAASAQVYAGGSISGAYSVSKSTSSKAWAVSGTSNGTFGFAAAVGGDDAINFSEDLSIGFIYVF